MKDSTHPIDQKAINDWLQRLQSVVQSRALAEYTVQFGHEAAARVPSLLAENNSNQESGALAVLDMIYSLLVDAKQTFDAGVAGSRAKDNAISFSHLSAVCREGFILAMVTLLALYDSRVVARTDMPAFESWDYGHNKELRELFTDVNESLRFKESLLIDALYSTNLFEAYWPEKYTAAMAESQAKSDKAFEDFKKERGR